MPQFIPGQRWISDTEPELGLGTVVDVHANRVTIRFLACGEERIYAGATAPLTRVRFVPGDTVEDVDGNVLTVTAIAEDAGLLVYEGKDADGMPFSLEEIELNHFIQFNKPQDRLFSGQLDPVSLFRLRLATRRKLAELEQSAVRGLIGARVSLIPHQIFIASEVAGRPDPRVMLADEVGLGKTIEAGSILHHRLLTGRAERVLLIVPEPLLHQWLVEMRRRFNLRFSLFDEERYSQAEQSNPFLAEQLVLCSLDFLLADPDRAEQLVAANWDLCVVDEAHHLHWTPEQPSPAYVLVERLAGSCPGLLLLTATPEQWGKSDHFARLRLLDPERFHDLTAFLEEERHYRELAEVIDRLIDERQPSAQVLARLSEVLAADGAEALLAQLGEPDSYAVARAALIQLMIDRHGTGRVLFRNTRVTVQGFPDRELHPHALELPEVYRTALGSVAAQPEDHLHPESVRLFDEPQSAADWPRRDPRVAWLVDLLKRLRPAKVLVICAKAATAVQLELALRQQAGIRCAAFHEELTIVARDRAAAWFADQETEGAQALICSEIGSEGRNFQFAHHLVLFDLPLNPDLLEQRIGRLDRIGQTATVNIHVPYFRGSGQECLLRWYAEGLDAFRHPCPAAQAVLAQVATDLRDTIVHPDPERLEVLVRRSQNLREELADALHRGRDRLLELSSCRPDVASRTIDQIAAIDRDPELSAYLERVFDHFGVTVEDHSANCVILTPSEHMRVPHFPELPEDGLTATVDRSIALAREDMAFLTWEHPLVRGAMDLLLNGEYGNAALSLVRGSGHPPGQLFVETFHIVESPAPRHLQIGRFLPPHLIESRIDAQGNEVSPEDTPDGSDLEESIPAATVAPFLRNQQRLIERLLKRAERSAHRRLASLIADAESLMLTVMTDELKRLAALRRVNPSVRREELDRLKQEGVELHHCIQSAQLRLDAVRIILTV
ncbi:RNA polymerase-associated protein RapA [Methylolobus aquaticus]